MASSSDPLAAFRTEWKQELQTKQPDDKRIARRSPMTRGSRAPDQASSASVTVIELGSSRGSSIPPSKRRREDQPASPDPAAAGEGDSKTHDEDFLALFLEDLDDINEVPLFDITLPSEVATRILSFLDHVTLCRCSQTSSVWKMLAEDDVLWHHIARQSQHKMPINLKPPAARWKPWFSKMTQQKREVGRRWKEMGAVFHQLKPPPSPRGAYNRPVLTACATYGGNVVGGYSNHAVATWDIADPSGRHTFTIPIPRPTHRHFHHHHHRPKAGAIGQRHRHPECPGDANDDSANSAADTVPAAAAAAASPDASRRQLEADALFAQQLAVAPFRAADDAVSPGAYWADQGVDGMPPHVTSVAVSPSVVAAGSSAGWLHIWHRATATAVFSYQLEAGLRWPAEPCPIAALEAVPTVIWATGPRLSCFSADTTPAWCRRWEVTAPGGHPITAMEQVGGGSAVVTLSSTVVGMVGVEDGRLLATLQDETDGLSSQCNCLGVGHGRVLFGTSTVTFGSAVKVFDGSTGRQMSALDIRRPADAISFFADDPQTVLVSSSAGLWCFDLRTEQKTHQLFLDGFKIGAVAADDWRVVGGGRASGSWNAGAVTAVWDRRMNKRLWFFKDTTVDRISQVTLTDDRLFSASAPPAQDRESVVSLWGGGASAINVLDFAAPSSELADAECPFSSNYDDIAGYRANDLLATPYDNVNPDQFG